MLVLLAILLSLSIACSEEMLRVSIIPEVEAYIDELSLAQGRKCSTDALQNCIRELESMGGKTASAMRLYCTVLVALDDGDFDTAKSAMSLLVLPNVAASFDESIVGSAGETSIATVEMLSYYLDGRAAESAGDDEAALEAYQQCAGEFDTLYRISAVKMRRFNKAVDLMLSGKYAEAEAILIALNAEGYEGASEYLQYCRNQMGRVEATATPRTAEVSAKMNALFTVGNYVTFGHYPQTKNGNDSTPIEWAVLARDGSKALLLSRYRSGSTMKLVTVSSDGTEMASLDSSQEVLSMSAAGKYIAVLYSDSLVLYTPQLQEYARLDGTEYARSVIMREDGTAVLIGSSSAWLYIP